MSTQIEKNIGYNFKNKTLITQALTHPSSKKNKDSKDYEKLEFLGDSVIGFVISKMLYFKHPEENEGSLAKRRAGVICKDSLAQIAEDIQLGNELILSTGEEQSGGRENKANLENAMEALIAAIYLDSDIETIEKIIEKLFSSYLDKMKKPPKDAKSQLQEWAQGQGYDLPNYNVKSIEGPSHKPEIEVELKLNDKIVIVKSSSKKRAEMIAAEKMLEKLDIK